MALDNGYEASSLELVEDVLDAFSPATAEQVYLGTRGVDARAIASVAASRADSGGGTPGLSEAEVQALIDASLAELGAGGAGSSVFILAIAEPAAQTNFDNISAVDTGLPGLGTRYSDNSDGASIAWPVALLEGTYALIHGGNRYNGSGILRFALNDGGGFDDIDQAPYGASAATIDTYAASAMGTAGVVAIDLDIPATGVYTLRATVSGKNASSSGFATNIAYISLVARSIA